MREPGFLTCPSCEGSKNAGMDIVAIAMGIVMFAVLIALIYGIERV
jgi:hypothetical protein